jgi:hypothetical protein
MMIARETAKKLLSHEIGEKPVMLSHNDGIPGKPEYSEKT